MKKTLLLVFIHGFKGSDHTFSDFPKDLCALLSHTLPQIDVLSVQYPQFETRGDLRECVAKFKEWLHNKVIDLEVANRTPSPTLNPSVHVVLCGHSMGGIVAAETLLSIAKDEVVPASYANDTTNATSGHQNFAKTPINLAPPKRDERASSAPPPEPSRLFFPRVQAVMAFDTPYLGISPGVLAHGAEEHFNHATTAYKAFDTANKFFGWSSPKSGASTPIANASSRGLPPANSSGSGWGKWALYGGAAAAVAGAAGAAYLNWNQINQGLTWAGSHLEFVGCLARGAELQQRVESVVALTKTHGVGFANFYAVLGDKVTSKTKYAGELLGADRTFCVVPKDGRRVDSPTGTKRAAPPSSDVPPPPPKRRRTKSREEIQVETEVEQNEQVREYAQDARKSKGRWVACINEAAPDELRAHTSMFAPAKNPGYHGMLPRARDQIVEWIDKEWYESAVREDGEVPVEVKVESMAQGMEDGEAVAGAEDVEEEEEEMDMDGEDEGAEMTEGLAP